MTWVLSSSHFAGWAVCSCCFVSILLFSLGVCCSGYCCMKWVEPHWGLLQKLCCYPCPHFRQDRLKKKKKHMRRLFSEVINFPVCPGLFCHVVSSRIMWVADRSRLSNVQGDVNGKREVAVVGPSPSCPFVHLLQQAIFMFLPLLNSTWIYVPRA